ncbi:MAG: hypothetical protein V1863_00800 [Candidatus Omnitrophota bacterium]
MDNLILQLNSLFTLAIIFWGFCAYTEMWTYHNIRATFKIICELLHADMDFLNLSPTDYYYIGQGTYRGRRVVCRINRFSPSQLFHYNLGMHIYMEPHRHPDQGKPGQALYLPSNTSLRENNRIYYTCTSSTILKSYLFASKISREEFLRIFDDLSRAAEIIES